MRIDTDAMPASERDAASRARARIREALLALAHRVSRVRLRRDHEPGTSRGSRWVASVALVDGSAFEVEQATPTDDDGAVDHFAERVRRAVSRRLAEPSGRRP